MVVATAPAISVDSPCIAGYWPGKSSGLARFLTTPAAFTLEPPQLDV
jgi:hypothetical protein